MKKINWFFCLFLLFLPLISLSKTVSLKPDHPNYYVVKSGDTVWIIANKFLKNPGEWKQLWHANPKVVNPDEFYPGAVLVLRTYKHKPSLEMVHNGPSESTLHRRHRERGQPIATIPLRLIKPYLDNSMVFDYDILATAPYVVAFVDEHISVGKGDAIYVKNLFGNVGSKFSLYRPNGYYKHPLSNKMLGFQADYIGDGCIVAPGNPAKFLVKNSIKPIDLADRLLVSPGIHYNYSFVLQEPANPVYGQVIALLNDALDQVGKYQAVVISAGVEDGLVAGDVLGIFRRNGFVDDPVQQGSSVLLPPERIGDIMIFKTFRAVSYGLVMHSSAPINMFDLVQNG